MIHPHTELQFISDEMGYGVVATQLIPKGTITWVQDKLDIVLSSAQIDEMSDFYKNILDIYTFRNNKGDYVLCWDHAKYVNHSFRSNCLTTPYDFEIAVRDIYPGEQLTDDYGYLNISRPFRAVHEGTRRRIVYPDDLLKYHKKWDRSIAEAFTHIMEVEQPLREILPEGTLQKIKDISKGEEQLESILSCYFQEGEDI
ncbi:SET domain-containing protein-lysine N-methyltransferase [Sinomicrobium pectinilyticum]|uniref:SET domain-containing protein-lysine N-methyltransferase n=1 Tax=Sinomicrobium pectinilyticum TaxID=1084421 RepID=A0A3N0EKL8_SINP1|nr:SET domain-containing protein [Sinomicrobium pectinilyticum]RNL88460.1 SET domain-containing protein-lysine N-methyltransferase [Sinomicrobium pectinilyticum]